MPVTINGDGNITGLSVGGLGSGVVNTATLANGAAAGVKLGTGSVIQTVTDIQAPATDNSSGNTSTSYADFGLSVTITPILSNSKIIIFAEGGGFTYKTSSSNVSAIINLGFTPSGGSFTELRYMSLRKSGEGSSTQRLLTTWSFCYPHTHGQSGAITYKCQHKCDEANYVWAQYRGAQMTVMEIKV